MSEREGEIKGDFYLHRDLDKDFRRRKHNLFFLNLSSFRKDKKNRSEAKGFLLFFSGEVFISLAAFTVPRQHIDDALGLLH